MIRIFDPAPHGDRLVENVLALLGTGPMSIRGLGNRLRRNSTGVRVAAALRTLVTRGVVVGHKDDRRNAWVYRLAAGLDAGRIATAPRRSRRAQRDKDKKAGEP